ncbi:MAG: biopolymer transporter ExbD [Gemmataceae bacterium]|nr:biopolymer transporter ExbD [Gemmataceae bacterium]
MRRRDPTDGGKVVLPITPMLDLTFQLLFFFIVGSNPADLEGAMSASLPAGQRGGEERIAPPVAEEPRFPTDVTVVLRSGPEGGLSAVSVINLEGRDLPMAGLEGLTDHLRKVRPRLGNKDGLKVRGDGKLTAGDLVAAMDACRAAGFTDIAVMRPE